MLAWAAVLGGLEGMEHGGRGISSNRKESEKDWGTGDGLAAADQRVLVEASTSHMQRVCSFMEFPGLG